MTTGKWLGAVALVTLLVLGGLARTRQVSSNDPSATSHAVILTSGAPSLGACGVGPSLSANAHDGWGTINVGTGVVTTCTLNFSTTLGGAPTCLVSTSATAVTAGIGTSTTALTVSLSLSLGSGTIFYLCFA